MRRYGRTAETVTTYPGSRNAPIELLGPGAFDRKRLRRPGTWAVAFVADWCPFCDRFRPLFATLRREGPFEIAFSDVTDEESRLWDDFAIDVIPTVIAFRDGNDVYRANGIPSVGLGTADLDALRRFLRETPSPPP